MSFAAKLLDTCLLRLKTRFAARMLLIRSRMFIPAAVAVSALFGLAIVCRELIRAPEGFEDESGFQLRRRRVMRRQSYRLQPTSAGLSEAQVN